MESRKSSLGTSSLVNSRESSPGPVHSGPQNQIADPLTPEEQDLIHTYNIASLIRTTTEPNRGLRDFFQAWREATCVLELAIPDGVPKQTITELFIKKSQWNSWDTNFKVVVANPKMKSWMLNDESVTNLAAWGLNKPKFSLGDLNQWRLKLGKTAGKSGKAMGR